MKLQFPEGNALQAQALAVWRQVPVAKRLLGGSAHFCSPARLSPAFNPSCCLDHLTDRKGSLKAFTLLNSLICCWSLSFLKNANNKLNTLQPQHLPTRRNKFSRKRSSESPKQRRSWRRLTLPILARPATRPQLGVGALPAGNCSPCRLRSQLKPGSSSLLKLVFGIRLRSRQLERPVGETPPHPAQPLFIVCAWRLRSRSSLGLGRTRGRAGLLALSPGACALGGRSLPLPLCAERVRNNVIAQRRRGAESSTAAAATTTGWGRTLARDSRDAVRPAPPSGPSQQWGVSDALRCRRLRLSTSFFSGLQRGLGRGPRREGLRAGGEGRFPEASRAAPAPDLGLGGGTPPPHRPPTLRPRALRPGFPCKCPRIESSLALLALCSPLRPSSLQGCGRSSGGNGYAAAGEGVFPIGAAPNVVSFCVVGFGLGWSGEEPFGRGGRAWKTWCHAPARRQHPLRLWLCSNPGEERVASCRLHCPEIQMWALVWVPSFYVRKRKISSCLTRGGKMWDLYPKS